jgi:hypothetical protein
MTSEKLNKKKESVLPVVMIAEVKKIYSGISSGCIRGKMIINDKWKLEADDLNIILMRKRNAKKDGSEGTYEYFYYATIAGALQGMLDREIKSTQLKDIKVINDKIEQVKQDIKIAAEKLTKNML